MTNNTADKIRNIAIIAHVDHGKTTLVDKLLTQSGTLDSRSAVPERVMDSNELEKERGITITSKNTAIKWKDHKINIVDTPGHADFGGEVERILSMVDSVLLVVDAVEGPMPQTRFVTQKAFEKKLNPIVVINKIDRDGARPEWAIEQVFDLFDSLGATDEQLDFPIAYASAIQGFATLDPDTPSDNMDPLLDLILEKVNPPKVVIDGPFQMQISSLDYSEYLGVIGVGRVFRGAVKTNDQVVIVDKDGDTKNGKINTILGYHGLQRTPIETAEAGDIIAITGIEDLFISDTVCAKGHPEAMAKLTVDEPIIKMTFQVNDSPFAGKEGKFVTSRNLKERLEKEIIHNVALRVEDTDDADKFTVSGRGELHLGILIETMRREGFELAVSQPKVILKKDGDKIYEPYELLSLDVEEQHQGTLMQYLGEKKGVMRNMESDGKGRIRMEYIIPARSLIGFHSYFQTTTSGTGISAHTFDHYGDYNPDIQLGRKNGVLISKDKGSATAYAIYNAQARGKFFITHQTEVYPGMIVGIHTRDNDLVINIIKGKKLTNMRASGTDENIILTPPVKLTLEYALDFINEDELVEITPKSIRLRKKELKS